MFGRKPNVPRNWKGPKTDSARGRCFRREPAVRFCQRPGQYRPRTGRQAVEARTELEDGRACAGTIGMERYILILLAVLLAASVGAFFFYVSVVPIITVSASIMSLALSFGLGAYVGRESADTHQSEESAPPVAHGSSQRWWLALFGKSYGH